MDSSAMWNAQDPTLSGPAQDDFHFLDMGIAESLQFDFPDFGPEHGGETHMMHNDGPMDTSMDSGRMDLSLQEQCSAVAASPHHSTATGVSIQGLSSRTNLGDLDAQIQFLQQQREQQQQLQLQEQERNFYVHNGLIPATPNSVEMHGRSQQFYSQSDPQQRLAMYERYRMPKEQDMAFTPLVSPAVTPLEPNFHIPEYTVPGAYFSPLSSPALRAQNENVSAYTQRHAGMMNSHSPVEMLDAPISSSIITSRKASIRKPPAKPRSTRGVRQSPIVKPGRATKKGSISSINPQALGDILEPSKLQVDQSRESRSSHSAPSTESENGSISPEHLSDMAPPPVPLPGPASRSPYIIAQKAQRLSLGSPATPASLMRITQSPQFNQQAVSQDLEMNDGTIDAFLLPEAASARRPTLSSLEISSDEQMTPTLSSKEAQTPGGFQSLPSPSFARPGLAASASQSPQIEPLNGTNGATRKTPLIAARGSKKRASTSVLASPALLPRISPSIKPLLPGGGHGSVSDNTASLLLASKSNYQNILEGTHLPGVSYPTELSTNLTSKRTSHKIAEQGRRNRINTALQEMSTLLPKGAGKEKDSGGDKSGSGEGGNDDKSGSKAAQSNNSKASTVEFAIEYIKQLQKEKEDLVRRAEAAEKKLADAVVALKA